MTDKKLLFSVICVIVVGGNIVNSSVVRETKYGRIQGTVDSSNADPDVKFYSFRGVPYGRPPTGKLRFQAPQPPEKWNGIIQTTETAERCPAFAEGLIGYELQGKEDCLYLDVFEPITAKPKNPKELLPVMVWIHGGTFIFGSINSTGPDYLMEKPVILVEIEYRLNVFGFLSTKDKFAEGNAGLKDQTLGLQWIQENIKNFGGDPERVTIFGESAGGASVLYHLLSERSKGLFQQAISQSGTPLDRWAHQPDPKTMVQRLAHGLGIESNDNKVIVEELQKLDYKTVITAAFNASIVGYFTPYYTQPFGPSVEAASPTAFLSESPYKLLEEGKVTKVPYIAGINTEEGSFAYSYVEKGRIDLKMYDSDPDLIVPSSLNLQQNSDCHNATIKKIREFYFDNGLFSDKVNWINFMSEDLFVRGIRKSLEFLYGRLPMYTYRFSFVGSRSEGYIGGVGHHEEVQYMLYPRKATESPIETEEDKLTRRRVVALWTNFAITGNPTPENDTLLQNIQWPETSTGQSFLDIGSDLVLHKNENSPHGKFWDDLFESCGNPPYFTY